jgi:transposase InsO family protein
VAFLGRARAWFAAHGIVKIERFVTDNGACYRSHAFAEALDGSHHRRTKPYTPKHNGKVERYNRILAEELLYARTWRSEQERVVAVATWNLHYSYPRRARRTTASIRDTVTRLQRPGLLQLVVDSPFQRLASEYPGRYCVAKRVSSSEEWDEDQ